MGIDLLPLPTGTGILDARTSLPSPVGRTTTIRTNINIVHAEEVHQEGFQVFTLDVYRCILLIPANIMRRGERHPLNLVSVL